LFKKDNNPKKVSLGVGAYRDNEGKPWILPSIKKAQEILFSKNADNEYLPIAGYQDFVNEAVKLAYTENSSSIKNNKLAAMQVLSGTGGLKVVCDYIRLFAPNKDKTVIHLSNPTWGNHKSIIERSSLKYEEYRYYDNQKIAINIDWIMDDINKVKKHDVVLFHPCAHNPTGCDLSNDDWNKLQKLCMEKDLLVLFDMAYQGFATGDTDKDAYAVRLFEQKGNNIILTQSFAKNMGLYGQRVGAMSVVCESSEEVKRVMSQLKLVARSSYSNPPAYGARLAHLVLSNPELNQMWLDEIKQMAGRIKSMRDQIVKKLKDNGSTKDWSHIAKQIGMFAYTGLNKEQVSKIIKEYSIYMTANGRISIAGLNTNNVDYVAKAMHEISKN